MDCPVLQLWKYAFSYPPHESYAFVVVQEDPSQHCRNHIYTGAGDIAHTFEIAFHSAILSFLGKRRYWSGAFRDFYPFIFYCNTFDRCKRYVWMACERNIACHTDADSDWINSTSGSIYLTQPGGGIPFKRRYHCPGNVRDFP